MVILLKWSSLQNCVNKFMPKKFYEIDPRDKQSSLFGPLVSYEEEKFYKVCTKTPLMTILALQSFRMRAKVKILVL